MTYIDQRRQLLDLLDQRLDVAEGPFELATAELDAWGAQIGLSHHQVERLFQRLIQEEYVRADYALEVGGTVRSYLVEDVTDKALVALGALPGSGIDGLVAVFQELIDEMRNDPALAPQEKARKVQAIEDAREALTVLTTELGPKASAGLVWRAAESIGRTPSV